MGRVCAGVGASIASGAGEPGRPRRECQEQRRAEHTATMRLLDSAGSDARQHCHAKLPPRYPAIMEEEGRQSSPARKRESPKAHPGRWGAAAAASSSQSPSCGLPWPRRPCASWAARVSRPISAPRALLRPPSAPTPLSLLLLRTGSCSTCLHGGSPCPQCSSVCLAPPPPPLNPVRDFLGVFGHSV